MHVCSLDNSGSLLAMIVGEITHIVASINTNGAHLGAVAFLKGGGFLPIVSE